MRKQGLERLNDFLKVGKLVIGKNSTIMLFTASLYKHSYAQQDKFSFLPIRKRGGGVLVLPPWQPG